MWNYTLSLKNLYRFLVIKDYPIYSTGIIGNEQKKGMTLVKFWKDNLLPEFKSGTYGKIIWKSTESRNRHTSEICNRSRQLLIYDEYMSELAAIINPALILRQIEQFCFFLVNHNFAYSVFLKKLNVLLREIQENDNAWNEEIQRFFQDNLEEVKDLKDAGGKEGFVAGWFMTFLTLHALTSETMQSMKMQNIRGDIQYSLRSLWNSSKNDTNKSVVFLTNRNSEICREALSPDNFWGRQKEEFDLRDMLKRKGHCLLSGIGGIGKTELLRQFLRYCVSNKEVEYVCAMQYENNMAETLLKSFPKRAEGKAEEKCMEVIAQMKMYSESHSLLILIDNVCKDSEEDDYIKKIAEIPAAIIMTSRLQEIGEFETYFIRPLEKQACELVFRDNCKRVLTKEDKANLDKMLEYAMLRHTLTLRLLGHVSQTMHWTVSDILQQLHIRDRELFSWNEDGKQISLKKIYLQLYSKSHLNIRQKKFLRVMASLPYHNYRKEYVFSCFENFIGEDRKFLLSELSRKGWIETDADGISMHPVIAESILEKPLTESEAWEILSAVATVWRQSGASLAEEGFINFEDEWSGDIIQSAEVVVSIILEKIGNVGEHYADMLICAAEILTECSMLAVGTVKRIKELLLPLCNQFTDNERVRVFIVCMADIEGQEMEQMFQTMYDQQKHQTIADELYAEFLIRLTWQAMALGELERVQECLEIAGRYTKTTRKKVELYYQYGTFYVLKLEVDKSYQMSMSGIKLAEQNKTKYRKYLCALWSTCCLANIGWLKYDKAEECLEQMEQYACEDHIEEVWYLNYHKGILYGQTNRLEKGISCLKKAVEYAGYYYGKNHINYAMECEELALLQAKNQLFEEAETDHKIALNFLMQHAEFAAERARVQNNLGSMYLAWNREDMAEEYLLEAYRAVDSNRLTMAEAAYNLSKLYRRREDRIQESLYLHKAYPVFQSEYADRSPKTAEVADRIRELGG